MRISHLFYHFFVPHSGNNHRAKALHHDALFAYALLFMVFNLGLRVVHGTVPDVLGYATDIRVEQLLQDTNAKRIEKGLSPLVLNTHLSKAALEKASDMFFYNYWAHNSPNGKTPWDFILRSGYKYSLAGENLAKNFQTSGGVVEAWMNSPTHRDNMIKPGYKEVGFAVVNGTLLGEETTLVVQMFGTPNGEVTGNIPKVEASSPVAGLVDSNIRGQQLTSVQEKPLINLASFSRDIIFVFVGLLMGILALDAYVVSRKGVIRLAGHNIAHIMFLASILLGSFFMTRGTLV